MMFNTSLSNISDISLWSVLLVEKTRVPGNNCRPTASHIQTSSHNVVLGKPLLGGIRTQIPYDNDDPSITWKRIMLACYQ